MPWCKKSKTYQLQKLEKAHKVLLSNHRKFEARYTKKAEGLNSLPSYLYKKAKGNRKSIDSTTTLLCRNKKK